MPVTLVKSSWSSGSLIFHESTSVAPSTTYNVFTLGTGAVKVGDTANDVDFQWYGTGSKSFILDLGAASMTLVGLATATDGAVTITNATATSSTTTGALIVTGGIATAADVWVGDDITVFDDILLSATSVINFGAGDVTITGASNALTLAGGTMNFGVDGTGVDVVFFGDTASAAVTWDYSDDALEWTGGAKCKFGVSGTELVYVAGTPIFTLYATAAGSGSTNCEPMYVYSILTGTTPHGGRSRFHTYINVTAGEWTNALKGYVEYGASGRTNGLGSAVCAEILLSAGTTQGNYAPLESELVADSAVSSGTATGFLYGNIAGSNSTGKTTLNTNGHLFILGTGVVDTANGLFDSITSGTPEFTHRFRVVVGGTPYYIGASTSATFGD